MTGSDHKIRPLVAGNWKMNGLAAALAEARATAEGLESLSPDTRPDVLICPPATLLAPLSAALGATRVRTGGQDCHPAKSGANTGDIAAEMLADAGATAVIVGHSERRADHGERDRDVAKKAEAAHRAGLLAIVCIGETRGQREAGLTLSVCLRQLAASVPQSATAANTAIAYEPVWAIGTGLTPTLDDVRDAHAAMRGALINRFGSEGASMRLLYGGSVKPDNARSLLSVPNVNGALVGGASLKAGDFLQIIGAYA